MFKVHEYLQDIIAVHFNELQDLMKFNRCVIFDSVVLLTGIDKYKLKPADPSKVALWSSGWQIM